jgi:hypothetical protein
MAMTMSAAIAAAQQAVRELPERVSAAVSAALAEASAPKRDAIVVSPLLRRELDYNGFKRPEGPGGKLSQDQLKAVMARASTTTERIQIRLDCLQAGILPTAA